MSTAANWARIRALFHRAMEYPADERAAFLREQCDDEGFGARSNLCWRRMRVPTAPNMPPTIS